MSEQKKTRILLVDDSVSMREMVGYTLKGAGYEVSQAEDGVEALKFAQGNTVDLVITDINMPNMDGVTFIKELKKLAHPDTRMCADHGNGTGQAGSGYTYAQGRLDHQARAAGACAEYCR